MSQHGHSPDADVAAPPPGQLYGILAEYGDVDALLAAAGKVREAGYTYWDTYTPIPIHGLDEAMGIRRTRLPWVVFGAGISGALAALGMQWWMNAFNYPMVVSGKPLLALPPYIPIIFEVTVLCSAIMAFAGMLAFNKLPQLYHGWFASRAFARRVTTDRFFIGIEARDRQFDAARTRALLEGTQPVGLETIVEPAGPLLPERVRKYGLPVALVAGALALVPPLLIAKARVTPGKNTRVQLIPDMDQQPKFLPQQANPMFLDNRAMRPLVAGTVAAGHADGNDFFYRGVVSGQFATSLPNPPTPAMLARGQERFTIFCAPCHGWDAAGDGPVAVQGAARSPESWITPTNLGDTAIRERADGHIFNTITHGIRTMPAYGDQIPVADRWAIVAYVRALQLSQAAPKALVPAERRAELK